MSRNKTIKAMHQITGEPYRICRAKLKANGWELLPAMGCPELLELAKTIRSLGDAVVEFASALKKALEEIDTDGILRAYAEIKERQQNRLEQCNAEHCTDAGCENCAGYEPVGGWL
jgi:hypothetical protein